MMRPALAAAALTLAACASSPDAIAKIQSRSAGAVVGSAVFVAEGEGVTMTLAVEGLTPGLHGIHMHEKGDCSAADGTSAGPHWNPSKSAHGDPGGAAHHAGDMGNLTAGTDGRATLTFTNTDWTLGAESSTTSEVIGRAIIVHASPDDFSQPAGNAGARLGCGVVVVAE
jgi:Cu-Zn family superoxide dismutase